MAPSRIGNTPAYGLSAASGASSSGFDSLNRKRKKPKLYPGQAKPKPPAGPGSRCRRARRLRVRLSAPPSAPANKTPIPPAMAGTVVGQPPRKRLKIDDDPFGAVGDYAGSFLVKSAVELSGGYDTNPGRTFVPKGSPFYMVAPEFLAVSDWERHAVVADLRGSFTGYGNTFPPPIDGTISPAPINVDRPDFNGHIDGRLDVSRDTRLTGQVRLRLSTDNPGSPNIQAGLAKYPVYTDARRHRRRRPELQPPAGFRRRHRRPHRLSAIPNSPTAVRRSNDDRNFNQFGGVGRVSYDLLPGVKPFGEIQGDTRVHDVRLDRNGFARNSNGGYVKAGTTFRILAAADRRNLGRLCGARLCRSAAQPPAGPADLGLADLDGDAADHGEIHLQHLDRRDHAARRLRRADAVPTPSRSITTSAAGSPASASSPRARSTTRATTASTRSTRSRAT